MPPQKAHLIGDRDLEPRAGVDVEVADGVALDLGPGRLLGVAQRGRGGGDGVALADTEEDRAGDPGGGAAGAVEPDVEQKTRRDLAVGEGERGDGS